MITTYRARWWATLLLSGIALWMILIALLVKVT